MRDSQKKIAKYIYILCLLLLQGSIPFRAIVPRTSGGRGIIFETNSPLFLADPVLFDNVQENLKTEQESDNKTAINDFVTAISDGTSGVIRGVYAEDMFALRIIQQPSGKSGYVSQDDGVVTQFALASQYGVTGLLAHNYLSGEHFFKLGKGDVIHIVYGDGKLSIYQVVDIQRYQALQPKSPKSEFLNLITGLKLSTSQLFKQVYTGEHHLTLQTCIKVGEEDSWGRLFIIANPL